MQTDTTTGSESEWPGPTNEAGTSLLELMLAMAAGFVILGCMTQALSSFQRQFSHQQIALAQQQDLRLGLELLEQELHLAEPDSFSIANVSEIEFAANIHGLTTTVSTLALPGDTMLSVVDGRGWTARKPIMACWEDQCEPMILARDGQINVLTVTQPITRSIPAGASVSVMNRVRYYTKHDEQGVLRLLRQVDGGASVLVGGIKNTRFSYWTERGHVATQLKSIKRIVVKVTLPNILTETVREISVRM